MNTLLDDLLWQTTEVTRTISAVAKGDLSETMRLEVDGQPLRGEFYARQHVNSMIRQMSVFTSEVTAWRAKWVPTANWADKQSCPVPQEQARLD